MFLSSWGFGVLGSNRIVGCFRSVTYCSPKPQNPGENYHKFEIKNLMSSIDTLSIRGIRSFSPFDEEIIVFMRPLTLILG